MLFLKKQNRDVLPATIRLLFCLILAGAGLFIAFSPPPTLTVQSTGVTNEYQFPVSDMPSGNVRVFLEHGDGTYFLGTSNAFANHKHTYAAGTYAPYADIIALYDDTSNPKRSAASVSPGGGGTAPSTNIDMGGQQIVFKRSCDAVAGDSAVYIVTYTHPNEGCSSTGTVEFSFDNEVFSYVGFKAYPGVTVNSPTTSGSATTISLGFSGLAPGEQRNVFFLVEALDNAPLNHVLNPQPNVKVTHNYPSGCGERSTDIYTMAMSGQQVLNSHDPNYKEVLNDGVPDADGYIYWRIHFQNEGNAPESTVRIDDWIDPMLLFNTVQLVGSKFPDPAVSVDDIKREVQILMTPIVLRGLGEPGASDESTRGYVDLKARIDPDLFAPCNAVANNARIYFGCNPPYTTETVLTPLSCTDIGGPIPCAVLLDTTFGVRTLAAPNTPVFANTGGILTDISGSMWTKKWYPAEGLSDPFALNPTIASPVCRTYTLVASNETNCNRVVIRVPVGPAGPLTLQTQLTPLSGCPNTPVWQLTATVPGGSPALRWNDCSMGPSLTKGNLSGGQTVYVAVWNTQTGCYAEKWVRIPVSCRRRSLPWVYAGAALAIILGFLLYRMRARR